MSSHQAPAPVQPKGTAWRELRPLLRPHRALIAVIALTVLLAEAFAVIPPLLMARIIDDHLAAGVQDGVLALALLYLGARAVAEGLDFVVTYLTGHVAQKTLRDLRVRLFAHLQRLPLSYYDRTPLGDAISRCTADVDTVDTLFTTGISRLLTRMVQLLTALAAMVILSPPLALFALLLIPPLALVTRFFQVRIRDAERDRRRVIGSLNVHLQETLGGVEVVRAFGHEDDFCARFRLALGRTLDAYRRALSYNVFYTPLLTVLVAAGVAFLLWVGTGGLGLTLSISIGTLTAFILLFQRFFEPIRNLGEDWQTVQSASSGIERIVQVLELPIRARSSDGASGTLWGHEHSCTGQQRGGRAARRDLWLYPWASRAARHHAGSAAGRATGVGGTDRRREEQRDTPAVRAVCALVRADIVSPARIRARCPTLSGAAWWASCRRRCSCSAAPSGTT